MGKGINTRVQYVTQETAVTPPHTATCETDLVIPVLTAAHDDSNFVPTVSVRVLDADMVADTQPGKRVCVFVVLDRDLACTGGGSAVEILCAVLPFLGEGSWVGGDARTEWVAI